MSVANFPPNTYVVLDIPSPVAEEVLAIREREKDMFRWSLPAETTVIGSSGVGTIAVDEEPEHVFGVLDRIAAQTRPLTVRFGRVIQFPNTDIFVLTFEDESPLRALHERLANSGMRFGPNAFDFTPHCTLRSRSPVSEQEAKALLSGRIAGAFTLDTMSVYQLRAVRDDEVARFTPLLCLLHRVHLPGSTRWHADRRIDWL